MQVNSGTLFMVQGLAQQGLAVCWGDGFAVDQTALDMYTGDYTAAGFFDQLLSQPYVDNVIISVHYYGPSISKNTDRCMSMLHSAHAGCGARSDAWPLTCKHVLPVLHHVKHGKAQAESPAWACRFSGTALVQRATTTYGYLNYGKGYCRSDGVCKTFPIVIGAPPVQQAAVHCIMQLPA